MGNDLGFDYVREVPEACSYYIGYNENQGALVMGLFGRN